MLWCALMIVQESDYVKKLSEVQKQMQEIDRQRKVSSIYIIVILLVR